MVKQSREEVFSVPRSFSRVIWRVVEAEYTISEDARAVKATSGIEPKDETAKKKTVSRGLHTSAK